MGNLWPLSPQIIYCYRNSELAKNYNKGHRNCRPLSTNHFNLSRSTVRSKQTQQTFLTINRKGSVFGALNARLWPLVSISVFRSSGSRLLPTPTIDIHSKIVTVLKEETLEEVNGLPFGNNCRNQMNSPTI